MVLVIHECGFFGEKLVSTSLYYVSIIKLLERHIVMELKSGTYERECMKVKA